MEAYIFINRVVYIWLNYIQYAITGAIKTTVITFLIMNIKRNIAR